MIRVHQHDFKSNVNNYKLEGKTDKENTDFSILTQNDFRSNVFLLVCFVPAPNNNKLEGKKIQMSEFWGSEPFTKLRHYTIKNKKG